MTTIYGNLNVLNNMLCDTGFIVAYYYLVKPMMGHGRYLGTCGTNC